MQQYLKLTDWKFLGGEYGIKYCYAIYLIIVYLPCLDREDLLDDANGISVGIG